MAFAETKRSPKQKNSSNIYLYIYIDCSFFLLIFKKYNGKIIGKADESL